MELQTAEAPNINSEMPFKARNLAGKWQFVMNNLTCVQDGVRVPVDNSRMNKGKFIADFWLAIKPMYNEFEEAIFHMGEPQCVVSIAPCNTVSGYPTMTITSANTVC